MKFRPPFMVQTSPKHQENPLEYLIYRPLLQIITNRPPCMCLCLCFHYFIFKIIFKILCICRYCFALSYGFQVFFSQYFCRYHAEKIFTKGKCMFVCLKFMLLKNFFAANKFWWEKSLANTKLLYLRNFKRTSKESYEQYWTFLDKFLRNSGQNIEVICSLLKILLYIFSPLSISILNIIAGQINIQKSIWYLCVLIYSFRRSLEWLHPSFVRSVVTMSCSAWSPMSVGVCSLCDTAPIITLLAGNLGSSGSRDEAVWRKTEEIFEEFFSDNS